MEPNIGISVEHLFVHMLDEWAMNWRGKKKGKGIECFTMLLCMLLVVAVKGSGPFSIDFLIFSGA
ncbi:hypothetical protein [Parapedobacter indicus]|uniref:Uncharacterized protein n=1 Tax=Parapedobacter indicus TaxID=1477437 RepID=A0A1I3JCH9_9SPHI|nr:hypothetical protein [Parapedobacter indicus]PPL02464.1 hypothetical protein CLV26_104394 [Parapedobacter indicus]SFI57846.1 hypothetical protein SAMN05444682_104393 [Parapedobacter indicus]